MDRSISGASVVSVSSPCGCGDQTNVAGVALGAEEVEKLVNDKLASLMAQNLESVDGKLASLQSDLRSWIQQFVTAELTDKQLSAVDNQQVDRTAAQYADLVRSQIFGGFHWLVSEVHYF